MRRFLLLALIAVLMLTLVGCSKAVGGTYRLDYITTDGVRLTPSTFGMIIDFTLEEDGVGVATYGSVTKEITWLEDGDEVVVKSEDQELRFTRDGKSLILHSDGTLLFFNLEEKEEED